MRVRHYFWLVISFAATQYVLPVIGAAAIVLIFGWLSDLTWYTIPILAVATALASWACLQLVIEFDERVLAKKRLVAVRVNPDHNCRRLVIRNPNRFDAKGCYVELREYRVISQRAANNPETPPGEKFRFAWGSWQHVGSALTLPIGAGAEQVVDIVGLNESNPSEPFFYHHNVSGNAMLPIRQVFPMPPGTYRLELDLGAEGLPLGHASVRIDFEGNQQLTLAIRDD